MPSFAASWESLLVFAVIVLLSAASNWLKQRQERRQEDEHPERPRARPGEAAAPPPLPLPPESGPTDWEKELRRLFGEDPDAPPPSPPRTVPAPPVVTTSPVPTSRQPVPAIPRSVTPPPIESEPEIEPIQLPAGTHFAPTAKALDGEAAPEFVLAPLAESASALQRAGQLQEDAIARLQRASFLAFQHAPARPQARQPRTSPEIARVRAQLRQPRTAREVILATVLLGPPRALDTAR
jgi:hypothetical protein